MICKNCGSAAGPEHFKAAPKVAGACDYGWCAAYRNGQEVISCSGRTGAEHSGLGQRDARVSVLAVVHGSASRRASRRVICWRQTRFRWAGRNRRTEIYAPLDARGSSQGLPTTHPGDTLFNLITFARTWIRPWAFLLGIEDQSVRDALLALFPDGCYAAFAGDTYCESRNESMDDRWRVMHALPGDGQNRPSVGDSLVQIQERYNTLSNIRAETYE